MAAPHAVEMESRLFLEHAGARFVVFAVELFRAPTEDLVAAARADAGEGYRVALLELAAPLRGAIAVPRELDVSDEAVDVAIAYVVGEDELVQRVYVTPDAASDGGCRRLGLALARTLTAGGRLLPDEAGPRVLEGSIGIDLPAEHRLVVQEGPDFSLCGTLIEHNEVVQHGSAIFFVSNDHSGDVRIDRSIIRDNTGGSWYPTYPQISNHDDTPIVVTDSTIE